MYQTGEEYNQFEFHPGIRKRVKTAICQWRRSHGGLILLLLLQSRGLVFIHCTDIFSLLQCCCCCSVHLTKQHFAASTAHSQGPPLNRWQTWLYHTALLCHSGFCAKLYCTKLSYCTVCFPTLSCIAAVLHTHTLKSASSCFAAVVPQLIVLLKLGSHSYGFRAMTKYILTSLIVTSLIVS